MITLRFSPEHPAFERIGNVNVYRIDSSKNLYPFKAYSFARELHKTKNYELVWAMMANWAGFAALFFKHKFPKVEFILSLQEGDPLPYIEKKVRFVYPLWKQIFKRADKIQAISHFLADWAVRKGYKGRVEVIPNGVDTGLFTRDYSTAELLPVRIKIGAMPGDRYLITTSRLVEKNGVGDVIESLKYMPEDIKFLILGTGPLESELKLKAKNLKLDARVKFLGFVPHDKMPEYLQVSDIFIRPSLSEGMGNSFIEAMAAGIPVIATPVGGISDFLFDPDKDHDMPPTGLFVEPRSPKLIAFQVQKLLSDKVLRDKIVINAKRLALEKYDWDLISDDMKSKVFSL
jgi:glycosyltransferase involved in cell wall biosynthesis